MPDRLLAIYLNDHLGGAVLGVELCRRLRSSNRDEPTFGEPLARICAEIEADRATLERLLERLGIRRDRVKLAAAWAGEKLGRLKLNGQLTGYSPLSRVLELEALAIGIGGKQLMWQALGRILGADLAGFEFERLAERAVAQRDEAERLRLIAADRALARQ